MHWSILVATLGRRGDRFQRLMASLVPQVERYPDIEVLAYSNNMERSLGEIRQALVEESKGNYVNFIDDDDKIPDYYCAKVYPMLDGVTDYVGWAMRCIQDGVKLKPTYHSLKYTEWSDDRDGFYRDISHLNPVRRELALKADFRQGAGAEDVSWCDQMRPLVKTEHYIPQEMYFYHANSTDSTWRGGVDNGTYARPNITSSQFRWHPESSNG